MMKVSWPNSSTLILLLNKDAPIPNEETIQTSPTHSIFINQQMISLILTKDQKNSYQNVILHHNYSNSTKNESATKF